MYPGNLLQNNLSENSDLYPESESCYLDGRYFNEVFKGYPGLSTSPLTIRVSSGENQHVDVFMPKVEVDCSYPILIRVITELTDEIRHSSLIIIYKKSNYFTFFDAVEGEDIEQRSIVSDKIAQVCYMYVDNIFRGITMETVTMTMPKFESKCLVSGWCNGHIIMYTLECLDNYHFSNTSTYTPFVYIPTNVKKFARMLEEEYELCSCSKPEIEYGNINSAAGGALVGGLGGLAIGGLVGGPTGALVGGTTGALGGFAIGSMI